MEGRAARRRARSLRRLGCPPGVQDVRNDCRFSMRSRADYRCDGLFKQQRLCLNKPTPKESPLISFRDRRRPAPRTRLSSVFKAARGITVSRGKRGRPVASRWRWPGLPWSTLPVVLIFQIIPNYNFSETWNIKRLRVKKAESFVLGISAQRRFLIFSRFVFPPGFGGKTPRPKIMRRKSRNVQNFL